MSQGKTRMWRINLVSAAILVFSGTVLAVIGMSRFPTGAFAADAPANKSAGAQYASSADGNQAAVSGTSTLHDWTVKTTAIKGTAGFSGPLKTGSAPAVALQSAALVIAVNSLKSTEGSGMDDTMYDALSMKQHPTITYDLTSATLKSAPTKDDPAYHFTTVGQLNIAGKANTSNLELAVKPQDNGQLTITTKTTVKMSDFGVTPPTAMLGMIKSGDSVTIDVTWQIMPQAPADKPAVGGKS